jgi:hypothetical protein
MSSGVGRRIAVYAGLAIAMMGGCSRVERSPGAEQSQSSSDPADSLVLTGRGGLEVWFTIARSAQSAAGEPCIERGLEIRRDNKRIQVPLLYTGDPPTLLNDSTMRAMLWTNCRPIDAYLVDLRNGRPVRQPAGRPS